MRYSLKNMKARSWIFSCAAALSLAFLSSASTASGPSNPFQIGAWRAGGYTNDQTGAFTQCSASANYKSSITMLVAVNRAMAWSLAFSHPQWALTKGERIPIRLQFDGGPTYDETGVVLLPSPPLIEVPMPDNSQLIKSFRAATQMTALARGQTFAFRLDGTSQLLPALVNCVRTALLAEANKPAAAPTAPTADNAMQEMQLATNFLLATRLSNARVVNRSDVPAQLASIGTVWKSDNAVGAVRIYVPKPDQKGSDIASELISNDAKACHGKFASGRSNELVDDDVVFYALTSCGDTQGELAVQYFVTPWHKTGFAIFAVAKTPGSQDQEEPSSSTKVDMFKKAALGAAR